MLARHAYAFRYIRSLIIYVRGICTTGTLSMKEMRTWKEYEIDVL